jgi:hypothetical protein
MYQTLILAIVGRYGGRNHARRFAPPFDAKLFEGSANALVDGMRTYPEADCDFLAAMVPVDQQQAFDLALAEAGNGRSGIVIPVPLFNSI